MAYNDKYDKDKYISKGYIMPDGTLVGKYYDVLPDGTKREKTYTRFHADMAKEYINTYHASAFENDIISDYKDYMLCRLGAIQVLSVGRPIIIYCKGNNNKIISDAIVSYLSYGWKEKVIDNPYGSYFEYLRSHLINSGVVPYDKTISEYNEKQLRLILKELRNYAETSKSEEYKQNLAQQIKIVEQVLKQKTHKELETSLGGE